MPVGSKMALNIWWILDLGRVSWYLLEIWKTNCHSYFFVLQYIYGKYPWQGGSLPSLWKPACR